MNVGVAILAAGASIRMGRPKMLLPWRGASVVGHIVRVWERELRAAQVAVVCAPEPSPVPKELDRLGFPMENRILNAQPERGMFSSVQCAAAWPKWNRDLTHIAVALGDQPHLNSKTLAVLLSEIDRNPGAVIQPSYRDRKKHPVVLPIELFRAAAGSKSPTLREFLSGIKIAAIEVDDPGLELDLDYPEDYQAACKLAGGAI